MIENQQGSLLERGRALNAKIDHIMRRYVSWLGVAICVIVAANVIADYPRTQLPDGPLALFWTCLVLAMASALLIAPPIFKRLPGWGRALGIILWFAFLIAAINETQVAFDAYMRTSAGRNEQAAVNAVAAKEAAEQRKLAAEEAANRPPVDPAKVEAQREEDEKEKLAQLDGCYSTFGHHLSNLESQVKDSLENPHAFEHVKTETVLPDFYGYNAEMTFRATNRMNAIITATVRAKINPGTCNVEEVGKIED